MVSESPKSKKSPDPERVLLRQQAYEQVKELIQSGVFPPQSAISERQLAQRLGMSKTPIRVALENLERQGLVSVSPQRGVLVKELSAREIAELFDVRLAVEPYAVSMLATRSLSRAEQQLLKDNLDLQRAAAKAENVDEATHLDIKFHRMLVELLDHEEFMLWFERIFDKLHRSVLRINRLVPGRLMKSYNDHRAIVSAILKPQKLDPAQSMRDHLAYGRQYLLSR